MKTLFPCGKVSIPSTSANIPFRRADIPWSFHISEPVCDLQFVEEKGEHIVSGNICGAK